MAKQRRQGRTNPELVRAWQERISAWATSGLTARAYCREQRLSEPSFYAWRRKLREPDGATRSGRAGKARSKATSRRVTGRAAAAAAPRPAFVPVTVVGALADQPPASIEIVHAGGSTVRIHTRPDADLLVAVFTALDRASSC